MSRLALFATALAQFAIAQPVLQDAGLRKYPSPSESMYFSWNAVPGSQGYRIQFDTSAAFVAPLLEARTGKDFYVPSAPNVSLVPGRIFWRVSSLPDSTLYSAPGTIDISPAPAVGIFYASPTAKRKVKLKSYPHNWGHTVKVQLDDDSTFASPLISKEGVPFGDFIPDLELQYGRWYWRMSTDFDYARFSPVRILVIDTGAPDAIRLWNAEPDTISGNVAELNARFFEPHLRFQLDTSESFAAPIWSADSEIPVWVDTLLLARISTEPLKPGKYFWRCNAPSDTTFFSKAASFTVGKAPGLERRRLPHPSRYPLLVWSKPLGAKAYTVQLSESRSFASTLFSVAVGDMSSIRSPSLLGQGKPYFWRASSDLDPAAFSRPESLMIDTAFLPGPETPFRKMHPYEQRILLRIPARENVPTEIGFRLELDTAKDFRNPILARQCNFWSNRLRSVYLNELSECEGFGIGSLPEGRYYHWRVSSEADTTIFGPTYTFWMGTDPPRPDSTNPIFRRWPEGVGARTIFGIKPPMHATSVAWSAYQFNGRRIGGGAVRLAGGYPEHHPERLVAGMGFVRVSFSDGAGKKILERAVPYGISP